MSRTEPLYADAHDMLDPCVGDRAPFGAFDLLTADPQGQDGTQEQS
ncbi:hypothetical protein [Streptomyces sp. NPDC010273]